MRIEFKRLTLKNFKSHRDLVVQFGDRTQITGNNAKGKSSIFDAITWILYGVDAFGSKLDPSPIGYDFDEVKVGLLLQVDEKQILLGRGIASGKARYWLNEVPVKATEYAELVESMFDKELFLSLFNPSFFFTLHWEKQRVMLLRYVTPPANKEVLAALPGPQADKLGELLKKHSLDDIEAINRERKNKLDKQYIAAQSRTKTLQEQLTSTDSVPNIDTETAREDISKIDAAIAVIEQSMSGADENNRRIVALQSRIKSLLEKRDRMKEQFKLLKDEPIADTCRVCKQPLQGDAVEAAKKDKERRIAEFKAEYDAVVAERKELEAELATLEYIDVSEKLEEIRRLQEAKQA
ncbi:AAA family ATPase, partial [Parageobacillus thermoglucosidasius]|uniref:AAA family ATPase n=1 Tax=Parageobacillus thermoglucosidasius TaxID=1426 RepID=UPI000B56A09A